MSQPDNFFDLFRRPNAQAHLLRTSNFTPTSFGSWQNFAWQSSGNLQTPWFSWSGTPNPERLTCNFEGRVLIFSSLNIVEQSSPVAGAMLTVRLNKNGTGITGSYQRSHADEVVWFGGAATVFTLSSCSDGDWFATDYYITKGDAGDTYIFEYQYQQMLAIRVG